MTTIVTTRQIKESEQARRRQAVADLQIALATYARANGGRYVLYGSAARGTMRHDSDVDLLADFPADKLDDAWVFAEEACWSRRLTPDIRPRSWCGVAFLDHIARDARVLA